MYLYTLTPVRVRSYTVYNGHSETPTLAFYGVWYTI